MTNKEKINRNIGLSFDFLKQITNDPEMIKDIENNATIEFLQKDYPEKEESKNVVPDKYIKVKRSFEMI